MLKLDTPKFYQVKTGQTLQEIAETFCVSAYLLAQKNGLKEEPYAGQILEIPETRGNVYTAREGDTKSLLCGSEENFTRKNGENFYLGMKVIL